MLTGMQAAANVARGDGIELDKPRPRGIFGGSEEEHPTKIMTTRVNESTAEVAVSTCQQPSTRN